MKFLIDRCAGKVVPDWRDAHILHQRGLPRRWHFPDEKQTAYFDQAIKVDFHRWLG